MSSALDDPTQRRQTLQRPRGGVDPLAVVSLIAGIAAIVVLAVGIPTWIPLWFAAIGLFLGMVSVLRSRPSAARWVGTIAIAASVVALLVMFYLVAI
jgi:Flp pilus assembly protein TadB